MKSNFEMLHTSSLLRKHQLLVLQTGEGDEAIFDYVDWQTHRLAGKKRVVAFENEEDSLALQR